MNTPSDVLLRDLRLVARQSGARSPTTRVYDLHGRVTAQALIRRFGSWNGALVAAGLPVERPSSISNAELFDNLVMVWRKLGRQPVVLDLVKKQGQSRFSAAIYENRFGTWNNALRAFDNFINRGIAAKDPPRAATKASEPRRVRDRINWRLRATVLLRDQCTCRMCGASPARNPGVTLHVDHIKPWAKGGATALHNLQTLCSACNIGKSDRLCGPTRPKTSRRSGSARRRSRRRRRG